MALRTTPALVIEILGKQYDSVNAPSLNGFIQTANSLTNYVNAQDTTGLLDDTTLEIIERWLSGWAYAQSDQLYESKKTGVASAEAKFQGKTGMYLTNNIYGQQAVMLDITGTLAALQQQAEKGRNRLKMFWLGTETSDAFS